jgi:hypothetical protein
MYLSGLSLSKVFGNYKLNSSLAYHVIDIGDHSFLRGKVSVQYSSNLPAYLPSDLEFEYIFNGDGEDRIADYSQNWTKKSYIDGGSYLMGNHYSGINFEWSLLENAKLRSEWLLSITDGSSVIDARYITDENLSFAPLSNTVIGFTIGIGGIRKWSGTRSVITSEFGHRYDYLYIKRQYRF